MNCFFHESQPSVRTCARCQKPLCEDCYHTTYPAYCWGCGLDYDNSLEEREREIEMPQIFLSAPVQYVMVKLAAASGSWIGVTLAGSFVLGLYGVPIGLAMIFFAIFSVWAVYTYGLACAVLVDLFDRFAWKISPLVRGAAYVVLGTAFPWLVNLIYDGNGLYQYPIHMLTGGAAALLFWGVERLRGKHALMAGLAISGLLICLVLIALALNGEMMIWEAGVKGWRTH